MILLEHRCSYYSFWKLGKRMDVFWKPSETVLSSAASIITRNITSNTMSFFGTNILSLLTYIFQAHRLLAGLTFSTYLISDFFHRIYASEQWQQKVHAQNVPRGCIILSFMPKYLISFWIPTFPYHLLFLKPNSSSCSLGKHLSSTATGNQKKRAVTGFSP